MYEVPIYNLYMEYILYISYYIHNLNKYNIRDNVLVCMHTYRCIDIIICRICVHIQIADTSPEIGLGDLPFKKYENWCNKMSYTLW